MLCKNMLKYIFIYKKLYENFTKAAQSVMVLDHV